MKPVIYVMIRYSVLAKSKNSWVIGRGKSEEEYKEELFSDARLEMHESLFRSVTLPSIEAADKPVDIKVLIFTSTSLPEYYLRRLETLASYSWAKVIPLNSSGSAAQMMNEALLAQIQSDSTPKVFSTVRLDDDDALAKSYFSKLAKYTDERFAGCAVTFPRGIRANYSQDVYTSFEKISYPKCAQGLAYVTKYRGGEHFPKPLSIFSLGNHTKIDEKFPVILDASFVSHIRTIHSESDVYSESDKNRQRIEKDDKLAEFIGLNFGIDECLLSNFI